MAKSNIRQFRIVTLYDRAFFFSFNFNKAFIGLAIIYVLYNIPINVYYLLSFLFILLYLIIAIIKKNIFWITTLKIFKNYNKVRCRRNRRLERNLKYFLTSNKLYTQKTIKQGDESIKVIVNCLNIGYFIDDKYIYLRLYKDGGIYSKQSNDFDVELCGLLGLNLDNKIETLTYCEYIFNKSRDKRIIVTSDNSQMIYNNTNRIPLSTNLEWNIAKQPHLLLAGVTGGGKTTFLNYLIIEYKKMQAQIYICDPKRSDLASLKSIIGSDFVASEVNQIAKLTRIVKESMEQRFIDYKENADNFVYGHNFVDYKLKPIVLFFDELGAFRAGADKKVLAETMANLSEIILKGREMGVFAILSTQQPNAQNIPTELRDNLSVRVALGSMSSDAYRMVFGADIKDLQPTSEVGTGYIFLDNLGWTKPKPFSAPYLDYKNFNFIEELKKYYD